MSDGPIGRMIVFNPSLRPPTLKYRKPLGQGRGYEEIPIRPVLNKDRIAVYTGPLDFIKKHVTVGSDFYKLYQTPKFETQVDHPNGTTEWVAVVPHTYRMTKTRATEKGVEVEKMVAVFEEDPHEKSVDPKIAATWQAPETAPLAGGATSVDMSGLVDVLNKLGDVDTLRKEVGSLEKKFDVLAHRVNNFMDGQTKKKE